MKQRQLTTTGRGQWAGRLGASGQTSMQHVSRRTANAHEATATYDYRPGAMGRSAGCFGPNFSVPRGDTALRNADVNGALMRALEVFHSLLTRALFHRV